MEVVLVVDALPFLAVPTPKDNCIWGILYLPVV